MTAPPLGPPVVWTGRGVPGIEADRDGWNTSPEELTALADTSQQLVVHDALSFPWGHLDGGRRRAVPFTVTLPAELAPEDLVKVLHKPLLQHVTAYDRIVEERAEVRALLTERYDVPPQVWDAPAGDDPRARYDGKARLYEVVEVARDVVRDAVERYEDPPLVGFLDRAAQLSGPVSSPVRCPSARFAVEPRPDDAPAPHLLVTWLADGGQTAAERGTLLARARDLLHPGGRLVVLGYVVTQHEGPANPSISQLVEELTEVFGGMLHVDDLRSVRWAGEPMSRGVALIATTLVGGRI